jgi:hypothetical protein
MNIPKLLIIKISHTIIWLFFNVVIFYILYAAIFNKIDIWVWIGIGLVFLEGLVLFLQKIILIFFYQIGSQNIIN